VTYVEIIQGVRNKKELNAFKKALGILNAKLFQIDELVSTKAMFLVPYSSISVKKTRNWGGAYGLRVSRVGKLSCSYRKRSVIAFKFRGNKRLK